MTTLPDIMIRILAKYFGITMREVIKETQGMTPSDALALIKTIPSEDR